MNRRTGWTWLAAMVCGVSVTATSLEWTLVVAPARYSVLQAMFDVARRSPVVLVSYQGDATEKHPALHAWNGEEWVAISLRDLAEVRFLTAVPARVILVGDEKTLPAAVADSTAWCPRTLAVPALDTPTLISEIGRILNFSRKDWAWFAARYRFELIDRNAPVRADSWYQRRGDAAPTVKLPLFRRHRAVTSRSAAAATPVPVTAPEGAIEVAAPATEPSATSAPAPMEPPEMPAPPPPVTETEPVPPPAPVDMDAGIK